MDSSACDSNAAPYVLGALSEEEHAAFSRHLDSCAVCREEVAALQVAAAALASAVPHRSAPAELKARVMSTVHTEARLREEGVARSARGARGARESRSVARGSLLDRLRLRPALAGGAVALAAVIALAVAVLSSSGGGGASTRLIQAEVLVPRGSASLRVSDGHAQLKVAGMPQTSPDRVYEVWIKRTGAPQPTNALFTVTAHGDATVGVPGEVDGVKQILVTSEPRGGSSAPTRSPVIVASLS